MTATPPPRETTDELAEIADYRRRFAEPGMLAGEFAELLPQRLRQPYWESKIRELVEREGLDPDAD